jgi:hypothetical protein
MFQTIPSIPVPALVIPAVICCMRRVLLETHMNGAAFKHERRKAGTGRSVFLAST